MLLDHLFGWLERLRAWSKYPTVVMPLPVLADGRKGVATSTAGPPVGPNKSRPGHDGDDWVYPRLPGDPATGPDGFGDGKGSRNQKWLVPSGSVAVAIADGVVRESNYGDWPTGKRLWIHHEDGMRSGYFHATELLVRPGERVFAGQPVIVVGDNPKGVDLRHVHFEISPIAKYAPVFPTAYLRRRGAVHAPVRPMLAYDGWQGDET